MELMYYFAQFLDTLYYLLDLLAKISVILIAVKYLDIPNRIRAYIGNRKNPPQDM